VLIFSPNAIIDNLDYGPTTDLSVTDTAGLGANAATELANFTIAGPITASGNGTAPFGSGFSLPLATTDDSQMVAVTVTLEASSNQASDYGSDCQLGLIYDHHSGPGIDTLQQSDFSAVSTSRKPMTLHGQFNHFAAGTCTVYLMSSIANSKTITVWQAIFNAEIIKR
jgi:hypothetical protein